MFFKNKTKQHKPLKLLLIGTLPPPIGGGGVMIKDLVDALTKREDITVKVVNTSGVRGQIVGAPVRLLKILWQIVIGTFQVDVISLHAAPTGLPLIGPIVCTMARLRNKPLIVRKFGGMDYQEFDVIRRFLAGWVVRNAQLYLPETKTSVYISQREGIHHVKWFPYGRPIVQRSNVLSISKGPCRHFVYLSQIRPVKGIQEMIVATERFDERVDADVYGPFFDGLSEEIFADLKRVHYRGIVKPGHAIEVLKCYDALLFPTYHNGEGYPGVILEAFRAGLPVISTHWKSIPELVDETCGILVDPRNGDALYEAMKVLVDDEQLYNRLRQGSIAKQRMFDASKWVERFVEYCKELTRADT